MSQFLLNIIFNLFTNLFELLYKIDVCFFILKHSESNQSLSHYKQGKES